MSSILNLAVESVSNAKAAWCRYITGNDTGITGSHQYGFYIPKCASKLLFDQPGKKGENKRKVVNVKWQGDFVTESNMLYYGKGSRNEYRITGFGKNFPFLQDENVGDLLILSKFTENDYEGYVLSSDEDIDTFFAQFNLSPDITNQLISVDSISSDTNLDKALRDIANTFLSFPETKRMALEAQRCYDRMKGISEQTIQSQPDEIILQWIDTEFRLFRYIEENVYRHILSSPFESIDSFIKIANEILNRRKSRAGKSLEHHLANIFTLNKLVFEEQAITENNKKPDFLFPNSECYHNFEFPVENLIVLGAKTTCKDRWRQVLTEGDRVAQKYLFTLQQGVSKNQLKEMSDSNLTLVVPQKNIANFPQEYQKSIYNLSDFIRMVFLKQQDSSKFYTFQ